ncbi:MAG: GNAT family N-acetyltransferase [Candidatus Dormibacteraeota bacterium]|nr:GNAT family N-acetyltransferase [Candidatus Dormibacteraeota bacterium]
MTVRPSAREPVGDVRIREAVPADVQLVASLIRELAEYERLLPQVTMTEELLARHLFGPRPYAEVAVAEDEEGRPLGFALFFHNFSTFLGLPGIYLEDLYVRPGSRGRGVGRALLEHLARVARQRGCGRLEWSVLDWNETAIGFYQRLGARPNSDWTGYRLEGDALARLASG